jgi:hypothetical protein
VTHSEIGFASGICCERPTAQPCKEKTSENFYSRQVDASADAISAPSQPDKNYERPLNYAPSGSWCVFL